MRVVNYSEFKKNLADNLNVVNDDGDILVVSGSKGKNVVVMSLEEYKSIQETLYLNRTAANRKKLEKSIESFNKGKFIKKALIES